MHVGQAKVAALKAIGQAGVFEAQLVQDGCIEVVYVDWITDHVVAEVVGLTVDDAWFNAAARHPHCEATAVMVAAVVRRFEFPLTVSRPAELAAPDDERFIKQSSLPQIANQCRCWLIDIVALQTQVARQVVVLIPASMIKLDESHAAFGHTPSQKTIT